MHIVHLGVGPDCIASCLLDLSEGHREYNLGQLWASYRKWCEDEGPSSSSGFRFTFSCFLDS